jgi:hypothetical protein
MRPQKTLHFVREILANLKVQLGEVHGQQRSKKPRGAERGNKTPRAKEREGRTPEKEERRRREPHRRREQTLNQKSSRSEITGYQCTGRLPQRGIATGAHPTAPPLRPLFLPFLPSPSRYWITALLLGLLFDGAPWCPMPPCAAAPSGSRARGYRLLQKNQLSQEAVVKRMQSQCTKQSIISGSNSYDNAITVHKTINYLRKQ